jgi:hypothetical protein
MMNGNITFELDHDCQLNVSKYNDIKLLKSCVADIKNKLEIKPLIYICGKEYNQSRNIGFFSDDTNGFQHFNALARLAF